MTTLFVRLLEEGTEVFRPTLAVPLGHEMFRLLPTLDYDPELEIWEFMPGSIVVGVTQKLGDHSVLVATRPKADSPSEPI
jgi:hypothetical protein